MWFVCCGGGDQHQPAPASGNVRLPFFKFPRNPTLLGGQGSPAPAPGQQTNPDQLTPHDVQAVVTAAPSSVNLPVAVAVTNRPGNILALYVNPGTPATAIRHFVQA